MIVIKLLMMGAVGLLLPTVSAGIVASFFGEKWNLKSAYLWGVLGLLALFGMTVQQPIKMNDSLTMTAEHTRDGLLFVLVIGLLLLGVLFAKKRKNQTLMISKSSIAVVLKEAVIVMALSCLLAGVSLGVSSNRGDDTAEIVNTMFMTDSLYQVEPLSGRAGAQLKPDEQQYLAELKEAPIELLYAVGVNVTRIQPAKFVNMILPFLIMPFYVSVYLLWGEFLFEGDRLKKILFQIIIWLLFAVGLCGNWSYVFDIFANPWNGETIFYLGVVPFTVLILAKCGNKLAEGKYFASLAGVVLCLSGKLLCNYGLFVELFLMGVYVIYEVLRRCHNGTSDKSA